MQLGRYIGAKHGCSLETESGVRDAGESHPARKKMTSQSYLITITIHDLNRGLCSNF